MVKCHSILCNRTARWKVQPRDNDASPSYSCGRHLPLICISSEDKEGDELIVTRIVYPAYN
jgi:hypothetical protein